MSKGWIQIHRKLYDSDISRKPPHFREVWFYLLLNAQHKDNKQLGLKRGELYRTYQQISDDLHWYEGFIKRSYSKHQIDKAMRWLREATMVATRKTTRGLRITVCKYGSYQDKKKTESDTDKQKGAKQNGRYKQQCSNNENNVSSDISDFYDLTKEGIKHIVFPESIVKEIGMRRGLSIDEMKPAYEHWLLAQTTKGDEVRTIKQHRAGFEQYLINSKDRWKKPEMKSR